MTTARGSVDRHRTSITAPVDGVVDPISCDTATVDTDDVDDVDDPADVSAADEEDDIPTQPVKINDAATTSTPPFVSRYRITRI